MFTKNIIFRSIKSNMCRRFYTNKGNISAGQILYNKLLQQNISDVFMYSGGSVMPLIDSFYQGQIKYFINNHEQNCGHAATGYAKTCNQDIPGVVLVTSGPGITNMITPMLDATNDSTPLVVISGQVPKAVMGTNAFQEAPATEISKHVTKWSHCVNSINELQECLDKAFHVAMDKKKGAVHLDIPKCVASDLLDIDVYLNNEQIIKNDITSQKQIKYFNESHNKTYINQSLNDAIEVINNSQKPILYLGQGCAKSYELLRSFAIKGNIPVTSTFHGCGIMSEDNNLSLQWCGMHGNAAANYALQEADCIIALGSRFDDRTTGLVSKYAPKAFESYKKGKGGIIHVNIESSEIGKVINSHYNFNISCDDFLQVGIENIQYHQRSDWFSFIDDKKEKYQFNEKMLKNNIGIDKYTNQDKLYMEQVIYSIGKKTEYLSKNNDLIITTGVGNHQMQTYQYIHSHYPKKIISSGSLGVMGCGLPYAIGAQIAHPNKTVILIDGDSSFNMTLGDLKTIVEHKLPVKIAIMNNDAQMMVTIWEKLFFEERYTATLNTHNPDFVSLAKSYGLEALSCSKYSNLDESLCKFLNHDGPILCEFKIEKGICLPLVGPGKALDDMILPENYETKIKIINGMAPS